jgi:hypothetical protein
MRIKMENLNSMIQLAEEMKEGGAHAAAGNT